VRVLGYLALAFALLFDGLLAWELASYRPAPQVPDLEPRARIDPAETADMTDSTNHAIHVTLVTVPEIPGPSKHRRDELRPRVVPR
jgi:hypothetical protein